MVPARSSLAINVPAAADVDAVIAAAVEAGGSVLRPAGDALEFEGRSGYFADPDGHPWEVAHNPGFELDDDRTAPRCPLSAGAGAQRRTPTTTASVSDTSTSVATRCGWRSHASRSVSPTGASPV